MPPGEVIVSVGPRNLIEQVAEEITKADARIEITDPITFRDAAFPNGGWTVSHLFQEGNCRRVSNELDVDYLVLIGGVKKIPGDEAGGIIIYIGFYGAGYSEEEVSLSATIIDLKNERLLHGVNSSAKGIFSGVGLFYGLFITPMTESGAIEGLGHGIAKTIIDNDTTEKVRIAVLALEHLEEALKKEQDLKLFQEKATQGDQDAQWALYQMQPTEGSLVWLCRAADQGQTNARNEIGLLYLYGSSEYRQFENVQIEIDVPRSCMWFHLAGKAKITEPPQKKESVLALAPYETVELDRTANAMTDAEIAKAEELIRTWKPGQCERDLSLLTDEDDSKRQNMVSLCKAADYGDFSARDELGRAYFFGFNGVTPNLPRAYLWYHLAAVVYTPMSSFVEYQQSRCYAMTPEQRSTAVNYLKEWEPGKCEKDLFQ